MPKKHITYCNPGSGNFNWEKPFDVKNLPGKLEKYGRVKVTFEKYVPMKSLKQLGYYRSGILPFLVKECGESTGIYDTDMWHEILKRLHGVKGDVAGFDPIPKSHARYTEPEMSMFIKKVKAWAAEFLGINIPPPTVIEEYV